jgi:predicted nucleic acid-binding protein
MNGPPTAQIQALPPGAAQSPGRRPARLPGPGRPGRLAGRQYLTQPQPVQNLKSSDEPGLLAFSSTTTARALQVRRGAITPQESQEAWERFGVLREQRLNTLPLAAEDFEAAARLALTQAPPLRAGDALHLALCQRLKLQLVSFDSGLCKAAAHHQVAHQQLLI